MDNQQGQQPQWIPQQPFQGQQTNNQPPWPPQQYPQQPQYGPPQQQYPQPPVQPGQFQPPLFYNQQTQYNPGPFPPPQGAFRQRQKQGIGQWFKSKSKKAKAGIGCGVIIAVFLLCSCTVTAMGSLAATKSTTATPTNTPTTQAVIQAATNIPTDTPIPTVQPTPKPTPTPKPPPSYASFGDGTYQVGKDIQPGTYRTRSGSIGCYYERLKGFGGTIGDIIANNNTDNPAIVTIQATDKGFDSRDCGTWTKDLSQITSSKTTFDDGMYIVGTDITPGTYRNSGGDGCYYARLSGFGNTFYDIIANGNVTTSTIITIAASDKGFQSNRCGTWTKL